MDNVRSSLKSSEKLENFSIIFKELLFWVDLSSSQFFLEILFHLCIFLGNPLIVNSRGPRIISIGFWGPLRLPNFLVELTSILIAVIKIDGTTIDFKNLSEMEIIGSHELAITLDVLLSFEEHTLRNTWVLLLFLVDGDRVVFNVEEHLYFTVALVFKVALNDTFLEEAEESEHMPI